MQIRRSTLDTLYGLTRRELDVFFYLVRYQDANGYVPGVHGRTVCDQTGICKQTFYNVLKSLMEKGLIVYEQSFKGDYDVQVLENREYQREERASYVNLNRKIFQDPAFLKMKAKEKLLLLELYYSVSCNRGKRVIGLQKFYEKYTQLLQVTEKMLRGYLHTLRKYFHVFLKAGKYFISCVKKWFADQNNIRTQRAASDQLQEYQTEVLLRRSGVKRKNPEEVKELIKVRRQYAKRIRQLGYEVDQVFRECIRKSIRKDKWKALNSRYVHKLVKGFLEA